MSGVRARSLERLVDAGRRMYEGGLVAGTLGCVGVRLGPERILVTARGSRLGFLKYEDIVLLDGRGLVMDGSSGAPDMDSHLVVAVMSAQPEAGAVIRVHPPYATALAYRGRRKIDDSQALLEGLGGVAFVPFYRQGTAGLAGAVAEAMRENRVALVERQGPVVRGADPEDAVDRAEALEAAAKVIFILDSSNGVPS